MITPSCLGLWSTRQSILHEINSLKAPVSDKEKGRSSILKFSLKRAGEWFEKWCVEMKGRQQSQSTWRGAGERLWREKLQRAGGLHTAFVPAFCLVSPTVTFLSSWKQQCSVSEAAECRLSKSLRSGLKYPCLQKILTDFWEGETSYHLPFPSPAWIFQVMLTLHICPHIWMLVLYIYIRMYIHKYVQV